MWNNAFYFINFKKKLILKTTLKSTYFLDDWKHPLNEPLDGARIKPSAYSIILHIILKNDMLFTHSRWASVQVKQLQRFKDAHVSQERVLQQGIARNAAKQRFGH